MKTKSRKMWCCGKDFRGKTMTEFAVYAERPCDWCVLKCKPIRVRITEVKE